MDPKRSDHGHPLKFKSLWLLPHGAEQENFSLEQDGGGGSLCPSKKLGLFAQGSGSNQGFSFESLLFSPSPHFPFLPAPRGCLGGDGWRGLVQYLCCLLDGWGTGHLALTSLVLHVLVWMEEKMKMPPDNVNVVYDHFSVFFCL